MRSHAIGAVDEGGGSKVQFEEAHEGTRGAGQDTEVVSRERGSEGGVRGEVFWNDV